jgi:hypothetical protein
MGTLSYYFLPAGVVIDGSTVDELATTKLERG